MLKILLDAWLIDSELWVSANLLEMTVAGNAVEVEVGSCKVHESWKDQNNWCP